MYAYATLVTNPDYVLGALALARSLTQVESAAPLVVLTTDIALDVEPLLEAGCEIVPVSGLPVSEAFRARHSRQAVHQRSPFTNGEKPLFHDPMHNFSKLRIWQLTQYQRVVFLDADTLVVRNIDKLFGYPEFSAAPNLYQSLADMHRMNSGVFVAQPDLCNFEKMLQRLDQPGAEWRRTDQTFLETYFPSWQGLSYYYNTLQYVYFNLPQLWHWPSIHVVHYQYEKPWMVDHPKRAQLAPLIDLWHSVLDGRGIPETLPTMAA